MAEWTGSMEDLGINRIGQENNLVVKINLLENCLSATSCDYCANYVYDEESESYYCDVNLDEDEYYRFISTEYKECPYYRNGDEYRVVRHQM